MAVLRLLRPIDEESAVRPNRHNAVWAPYENESLVAEWRYGLGTHRIALLHERTEGAVWARLRKLDQAARLRESYAVGRGQ